MRQQAKKTNQNKLEGQKVIMIKTQPVQPSGNYGILDEDRPNFVSLPLQQTASCLSPLYLCTDEAKNQSEGLALEPNHKIKRKYIKKRQQPKFKQRPQLKKRPRYEKASYHIDLVDCEEKFDARNTKEEEEGNFIQGQLKNAIIMSSRSSNQHQLYQFSQLDQIQKSIAIKSEYQDQKNKEMIFGQKTFFQQLQKMTKNNNFEPTQRLNLHSFRTLAAGQCLNDTIINIYLKMLDKCFIQNVIVNFKLVDSFFCPTILPKDEALILRFLSKRKITPQYNLIMPINYQNHWYFAGFFEGLLTIYDSMRQNKRQYQKYPLFKNALKFAKILYGKCFSLSICQNFPQQTTTFDCGIFMLMGIRDILESKQWSFSQADINLKRGQIAHEISKEASCSE